ncbi:NapC/NirT family cytochrome c [Candidatus Nitrospira inopinata]|jgi:nitrate/TMAO reductase-like tetraheme cytochrome c subunit|uniref:NapC/NirT cytochrome c N-terminal domain-containing protein n=1 Tax=Candidatus Nitrospira inopinata TaxID=1715989 RepID=A0A0S4KUW6_9BACT|nr:NapC/NirT family cytochrome c [Candidatus Nitrospira inopinata]CUQ67877.1 conserved membrane protein of unknown function [Candidatus Nitrospira inopinata]
MLWLLLVPWTILIEVGFFAYSAEAAGMGDRVTSVEVFRAIGIAAALVGIALLFLVQYVYRSRLSHGMYHRLLLIGVFLLPLATTWSTSATVMEGTKSVEACRSCHVMHPFVDDMTNPSSPTLAARHYRNNWIAKDQCYACHVTYGITGTLEGKRDGFRHWIHYITGTYPDPIRYVGSYDNANCLACHQQTEKWSRVSSHRGLLGEFATNRIACITCHGPPHPLPKERMAAAVMEQTN